jgi:uncharacterized protein YggT (Ycf19 family)
MIILDAIMSYFPQYQNQQWAKTLKKATDYTLKPIRKLLPNDLPMDFSPWIVVFLLNLVKILW